MTAEAVEVAAAAAFSSLATSPSQVSGELDLGTISLGKIFSFLTLRPTLGYNYSNLLQQQQ